ncbi:hypothetical protein BDR26DRAFT_870423 [Obelidium mucronatum]|nr:hypothetical protein BDR26DRAFT_870423 [Obelidium mucronatum]
MKRESVETLVGSGRVTPTVQTVTDQVPNEITKPVAVQPTRRPTITVSTSRSPSPTTPTAATASASASGPHQPTLAFEKLQIHQDSPSPSMPGPDSPLPSPTSSPKPRIKKTHDARPREFHCEICNGRFLRRQDLRRHEVTHSKSREFYCPFECGSSFGRSDALARHLKTSKCSLKASH